MKILFIGGTGNISTACSRLAVSHGFDLYLLNRGRHPVEIPGAKSLMADINQPEQVRRALGGMTFDAVVNWIAYSPLEVQRDIALFRGKTRQHIFISSASAYQKPLTHPVITESTPLSNPFWEYSRNKIACEALLQQAYRQEGFPATIVRPSHTYDTQIPSAFHSGTSFGLIARMRRGEKVIIHGDGTSLWVMTHAEDFAKGFVGLLANPHTIGHAFHITSDEVLTWNQIYETIAEAAGAKLNAVHIPSDFIARYDANVGDGLLGDKAYSVIFDNTKIKTFVPGYCATIPFHEGIRRTLAWFEADPARQKSVPEEDASIDRILAAYELPLNE